MSEETAREALQGLFAGLMAGKERKDKEAFEALAGLPAMRTALECARNGDFTGYRVAVRHGVDDAFDGMLKSVFPDSHEARFLMGESGFVERHMTAMFRKYEGLSCCADKSRTAMRGLLAFFRDGKEIMFDYGQQYTFHLPEKIMKEHDQIEAYFRALYRLFYGQPDDYLALMARYAAELKPAP